jgi:hypothetical protein
VSLHDVLTLIGSQVTAGAWTYDVLHDARRVTWMPTTDELQEIASHIQRLSRQHGRRGRIAFIAVGTTLVGMARMYEFLGEEIAPRAGVFYDPAAAEQWLQAGG